MDRQGQHHRQHALDALTRNSSQPPSSARQSRKAKGHGSSVWSDDELSTRRMHISGGYDQRFNHVDLGTSRRPSTPSTQVTVPTPTYYGPPLHRTSGVIIWSADAEIQNEPGAVPKRASLSNRISVAVQTSRTFWQRLRGHGRERVGWKRSLKAIATFSCESICRRAQCELI